MRYRKYYPTLLELLGSGYAGSIAPNLFSNIHWFDGTLSYVDYEGNSQTYPDLGFEPADLWQYWSLMYEELRIGYPCKVGNPWSGPSAAEWTTCAANFLAKAQQWLKLNENKFLGLVKTYGLKYDPISNYDMVETEGKALKEGAHSASSTIVGSIITDMDSPETQSQAYSTTYDDASDTRLSAKTTAEFLNNYRKDGTGTDAIPITRTKQHMEAPEGEVGGYKTTSQYDSDDNSLEWGDITTPDSNRAEARQLIRKGNIGVMTSQQMIESERELARQNILEEFFREFNKGVMGAWH